MTDSGIIELGKTARNELRIGGVPDRFMISKGKTDKFPSYGRETPIWVEVTLDGKPAWLSKEVRCQKAKLELWLERSDIGPVIFEKKGDEAVEQENLRLMKLTAVIVETLLADKSKVFFDKQVNPDALKKIEFLFEEYRKIADRLKLDEAARQILGDKIKSEVLIPIIDLFGEQDAKVREFLQGLPQAPWTVRFGG